jgi:threonine/homoserine/homoserine lactone efflux protein
VPTQHTLVAFAGVSLGITVIPGPSTLFILAHGIGRGRADALAAMLGIEMASAIRVLATAAGLSTLLAASAIAFTVVRWAGVVYLVYLGVKAFTSGPSGRSRFAASTAADASRGGTTRKGILVGLTNPKMAMFFLAFFPQFVDPSRGSAAGQILILGLVFWVIGVIWDLALAWASGSIGSWLHARPHIDAGKRHAEGVTYLALAGWSAFSDRPR